MPVLLLLLALTLLGDPPDDTSKVHALTAVRASSPPTIDGSLDEPTWQQASRITGFTQLEPDEGKPASQRTVVHILYDDAALYVGARLYDQHPDSIVAQLGRRDADLDADLFGVFIDSYHDHRTGFYFGVNAAGTLYDGVLYNDDWDDSDWDGVWQGRTRIDEEGWTAELRIPLSQLRFHQEDVLTWGINFRRDVTRRNERSYLVHVPRTESGFVSRFADLTDLRDLQPPRQLEIVPYARAKAEYVDVDAQNPFHDGTRYAPGFGADFRVGLTSNLTLNGTVNPDFGQVEVDPAVVNLSDVETFFPEKRPFFIEGATIFNYGYGGSSSNWGFNWSSPQLFYTRRIGRAPQGSLPSEAVYSDVPDGTRILGATKLTGQVGGWNVGTVQSVTAREWADVRLETGATNTEVEVEPLTYYGVYRGQREWDGGRRALGFMSTAVARSFDENRLRDQMNERAYVAGLDGWTFLDGDKTWVVTGWLAGSHVGGTKARMLDLQQSSQHYFQRPDASHVSVDSSRTSLTGAAGRVLLNRQTGNVMLNSAVGFISPSFDVNDVGFQSRTDVINGHFGGGYRWTEPALFYRRAQVLGALFRSQDFDGNVVWQGVWGLAWTQFRNYLELEVRSAYNPETVSNRRTRGGPLTINPPGYELGLSVDTDRRKMWIFGLGGYGYSSGAGDNGNFYTEVTWRPASNLSFSLEPQLSVNRSRAQWVDAFDDATATHTYGTRYVFADLDQTTLSASLRLNWTFTPQLSLQLYAQPLLSTGDYTSFKELAAPRSLDFDEYENGEMAHTDDTYTITPDGGKAFSFDDPDFSIKSLRGNAVLRWEYRPGSTLYLVWTQSRFHHETLGNFQFRRSVDRLWSTTPDNIFVIKMTYWLGR